MSAAEIAKRHFSAAIAEAEATGLGHDSVCRALLGRSCPHISKAGASPTSSPNFALSPTIAIPRQTSPSCAPSRQSG